MLVYPYKHSHVITSALDKVLKYSPLLPTPRGHYLLFTSVRFDSLLTPPHQRAATWIQFAANNIAKRKQTSATASSCFSRELPVTSGGAGAARPLIAGVSRWQESPVACWSCRNKEARRPKNPPSWLVTFASLERWLLPCQWRGTSQQLVAAWHRVPTLL